MQAGRRRAGGSPAVLQVLAMNPNKRGPVELQLAGMARALRESGGRQICAFTHAPPPWYGALLDEAGCEHVVIPDPAGAGAAEVAQLVSRRGVALVHLHFVSPRPLAALVRRAGAARVVMTDHVYRAPRYPVGIRALVRHARARRVDVIIAVSRYSARQIRRDYLVGAGRIRLIVNGVDLDLFRPADDKAARRRALLGAQAAEPLIAVASHLDVRKRVDMVIRAVGELCASGDPVQLVIAGDGADRPRLEELVRHLSLEDRVDIRTGDNRVWEVYGAADLAVSASAGEGMPGSVMEAMACGIPVVTTPCGGQAEVAEPGVSGVHVADQTPGGLAAAIRPLLRDPARRAAMGRAARARAEERFDLRRTVAETIGLYHELVGTPG